MNKISTLLNTDESISSLNIDLSALKTPNYIRNGNNHVNEVKIGTDMYHYTLKIDENTKHFVITDPNDNIIIEHINDARHDLILNGKSINTIWQTLENHYEVLKALSTSA